MNVLITGGAGFIGTYTSDLLRAEGHKVFILDNLSTGLRDNVSEEAKLTIGDIRDKSVYRQFENENIDTIIHLAAQVSVPVSVNNPIEDQQQNIEGTIRVIEAAKELNVKKIIFASSAAVYGDSDSVPIVEEQKLVPTSPYGISKMTAEHYLQVLCKQYGIDYIILRYANVYGAKQTKYGEGGVIKIFVETLLKNEAPIIFGNGEQTRDFIYVEDIARAHIKSLIAPSGIYNISSNKEITINRLYDIVASQANSTIKPNYEQPREGDIFRSCLSNEKAIEFLKWEPIYTIEEGLSKTIRTIMG